MTEKKVIKGRILDRVKAAEDSLARQETKSLEAVLPEGHPLRDEVEKQKALLGGDLSGLPPGHPLLRALQAAKEAYDRSHADVEIKTTEAEKEQVEPRRAKRLEEADARKKRIVQEEAESGRRREAAKIVNKGVDEILASVRNLWEKLAASEEVLTGEPMNRARIMRMKQMLVAIERRFSETRLSRF